MKKIMFTLTSILALTAGGAPAAEAPGMPAGHPAMEQPAKRSGHSMMGMGAAAPQNAEPISGKVLETMDSGGYSYVHLQKKNGEKIWLAVEAMPVNVGNQMNFKPGMVMSNFESKGLKRTFDKIVFSEGPLTTPAAGMPTDLKQKQDTSPGSKGSATAKENKIKVAKASGPNAVTVEEAFLNSAKLDKKKVVVRGKVVKVSTGIMKRNWVHIQDGSGTQAKGTHNLVCTSQDLAKVGDVVTVSGTLAKDRDFGSGYRYDVIIENAKLKK